MPTYSNRLYQVIRNFQFRGAKSSLSHYCRRALSVVAKRDLTPEESAPVACDECFAEESLDARLADLVIESPNAKWGLPYVPTHQEFFDKVVQKLPVRLEEYSFVDLGAGKGRALLLAASYPFKDIIGVEYSRILADVASSNTSAYKKQGGAASIRCIWGDATEFELPQGPTVLYLYNPFQGKVMDQVIANIEESLRAAPHDLWIVYGVPGEGRKFRRNSMFETVEWNSEYSVHRSTAAVSSKVAPSVA